MGEIQTQIECWRKHEISGEQLLRDFVGHEDWLFCVAEGGVEKLRRENGIPDYIVHQNERGENMLFIFSDVEMFKTFRQHSNAMKLSYGIGRHGHLQHSAGRFFKRRDKSGDTVCNGLQKRI